MSYPCSLPAQEEGTGRYVLAPYPRISMDALQLQLLGTPRFVRDGRPVELGAAKAIAVMAYLALTPAPPSRERLLTLLWADSPADAARKNLRNTLWVLRKALGDEAVLAQADRLALHPRTYVDVAAFEQQLRAGAAEPGEARQSSFPMQSRHTAVRIPDLAAAVELYRGPFLDDIFVDDAPEFEVWLTGERERLHQANVRALALLVDAYRDDGRWVDLLIAAQRVLKEDPLQEPMYRALMEAHTRLGDRAEAMRQYDLLRASLERELGVEPLPETVALRERILHGGLPSHAAQDLDTSGRQTTLTVRETRPAPAPRAPFIGRRAEREALDAARAAAARGQTRIVLIAGELGIGKTRLWQEWSAALPAEQPVLAARCLESTRELPFLPITELLSTAACMHRLFAPPSPVADIWLTEVARLIPRIRVTMLELPAPPVLPPDEERRRVFEAFAQTLRALEARPLVLFVDDLHWADQPTLAWLDYLVHRFEQMPLLLCAAYRPVDSSPVLAQMLNGWLRMGFARRLDLDRLASDEAARLVAALGQDVAHADRIYRQSAGNPYFVIELSLAAPGDVPPMLADLVRARIERLPEAVRQVLQAASVLEPDFSFVTLRRTSGRSEEETLDALDVLLGAALLVESDGRCRFAHPLIATVVQRGLSSARRGFLHRRAAEARQATHADRLPPIAGQLAAHFLEAGDTDRAAHFSELAAEHVLTLAAPMEAVAFYRQSLLLAATPSRQLGLARALEHQGELAAAVAAYQDGVRMYEARNDRAAAGRASLALAHALLSTGAADEVLRWARHGLDYLEEDEAPDAHALGEFLLGAARLQMGHALEAAERHLYAAAHRSCGACSRRTPDTRADHLSVLSPAFVVRGVSNGSSQPWRVQVIA